MMERKPSFTSHSGGHLKGVFPSHLARPCHMAERALKLARPESASVFAFQSLHMSGKFFNLQEFHGLYWQTGQGHSY